MSGAVNRRRTARAIGAAVLVGALLVTGLAAVTGCSQHADAATPRRVLSPLTGRSAAPAGPSTLTLAPAPNTANVSPATPVTVAAGNATIDAVTLTDPQGKQVAGALDPDKRGWHSTEPLGYNKRYTLKATGTGSAGQRLEQTATFGTVKPTNLTLPYLRANNGLLLADRKTYGVGQIIIVGFDEKIPDRAAAERSLQVVTDPPVQGVWHWSGDREVQWRPERYWQPNTKVTVKAGVYGKDLGKGLYGESDVEASFTIGPSKIAVADDNTHHIEVSIDGQPVKSIPTAMGKHESTRGAKGQYIDFRTRSGVHVVLGNDRVTHMTSASFGITTGPNAYDEQIEWTTHLSYQGEYVHAAPWSVAQQGHSDASHGCLNVNTENAIWFYNTFGPGDVVDIRNTGLDLDPGDGLTGWNMSWDEWVKGSALPPPGP
jgi:lipoprotein-anchoring transpeptidase ErfK/SrfK